MIKTIDSGEMPITKSVVYYGGVRYPNDVALEAATGISRKKFRKAYYHYQKAQQPCRYLGKKLVYTLESDELVIHPTMSSPPPSQRLRRSGDPLLSRVVVHRLGACVG